MSREAGEQEWSWGAGLGPPGQAQCPASASFRPAKPWVRPRTSGLRPGSLGAAVPAGPSSCRCWGLCPAELWPVLPCGPHCLRLSLTLAPLRCLGPRGRPGSEPWWSPVRRGWLGPLGPRRGRAEPTSPRSKGAGCTRLCPVTFWRCQGQARRVWEPGGSDVVRVLKPQGGSLAKSLLKRDGAAAFWSHDACLWPVFPASWRGQRGTGAALCCPLNMPQGVSRFSRRKGFKVRG